MKYQQEINKKWSTIKCDINTKITQEYIMLYWQSRAFHSSTRPAICRLHGSTKDVTWSIRIFNCVQSVSMEKFNFGDLQDYYGLATITDKNVVYWPWTLIWTDSVQCMLKSDIRNCYFSKCFSSPLSYNL